MSKPTWSSYFFRVGGAFAIVAGSILVARKWFPGNEAYFALGVSVVGICFVTMKERWSAKRAHRKGKKAGSFR